MSTPESMVQISASGLADLMDRNLQLQRTVKSLNKVYAAALAATFAKGKYHQEAALEELSKVLENTQ